ncbi:hypothetical protein ABZ934_32265 [Streptomyces sp. NPDC046557]|uniref:hypothetical protein n=1 Tax=Streptomyces sp. NPDC046557 TaxID=3155372 RepID=UPI0033BFD4EA
MELARLLLADMDPAVRGIHAQPFHLDARVGDRVRQHVPDFLLITESGAVRVVNVKPADRLTNPGARDVGVADTLVLRQRGKPATDLLARPAPQFCGPGT